MWVAAWAPDVINGSKGKSSLLFVDSLGMVNFLQWGPGILQFLGSVLVDGRTKAKWLARWCIGANLVTGLFGSFGFWLEGMMNTECMNRVQQVW